MNYQEFKEGINILIASFPIKSVTEEKTKVVFETYFDDKNFDPNIWVKVCKIIGGTKSTFPVPTTMKSIYWEVAKENKKPATISHTECPYCNGIGLRSYYKYKGHREDGSRVKYTYCAICDCEAGAKYSPNLNNGKHWATWSEKEKQGKFIQHEKEIIPEFVPYTNKYAEQEETIPF